MSTYDSSLFFLLLLPSLLYFPCSALLVILIFCLPASSVICVSDRISSLLMLPHVDGCYIHTCHNGACSRSLSLCSPLLFPSPSTRCGDNYGQKVLCHGEGPSTAYLSGTGTLLNVSFAPILFLLFHNFFFFV